MIKLYAWKLSSICLQSRFFSEGCSWSSSPHQSLLHLFTNQSINLLPLQPLLKKPGLDVEDMNSFRPVSNLSFLSKIVERAMLDQLLPFLEENKIIPKNQSAYLLKLLYVRSIMIW